MNLLRAAERKCHIPPQGATVVAGPLRRYALFRLPGCGRRTQTPGSEGRQILGAECDVLQNETIDGQRSGRISTLFSAAGLRRFNVRELWGAVTLADLRVRCGSSKSLSRCCGASAKPPRAGIKAGIPDRSFVASKRHRSVGFVARPLVLGDLSCGHTTRRLPKLCGCHLPIEGVVARSVLFQVIEPRHRLLDARPVANRHPPHHEIRTLEMLEPFRASPIEALVQGQINEAFERFHVLPNR